MSAQRELENMLKKKGILFDDNRVNLLLKYLNLLVQWNKKHNLTRIAKSDQLNWNIADALSVHEICCGTRILDVGTGAGLPGIPLSLFNPEKKFYLLDNNFKKITFVKYVINDLQIHNAVAVHANIQEYDPKHKFHTIVSRAFATLGKIVEGCSHLLAKEGQLIAMKGKITKEELSQVPKGYTVQQRQLEVPELQSRCAVVINRVNV